jgi:hypothetical protein
MSPDATGLLSASNSVCSRILIAQTRQQVQRLEQHHRMRGEEQLHVLLSHPRVSAHFAERGLPVDAGSETVIFELLQFGVCAFGEIEGSFRHAVCELRIPGRDVPFIAYGDSLTVAALRCLRDVLTAVDRWHGSQFEDLEALLSASVAQ